MSKINVAALAAVLFALVAIFLFPSMVVVHSSRDARGIPLDLAKAQHLIELRGATREDAVFIAVERDGVIMFDRDRVWPDQLPTKIRESIHPGAERKVYIRADRHAKYGAVLEVLRAVRSAGVEQVAFELSEKRETPTSSAH